MVIINMFSMNFISLPSHFREIYQKLPSGITGHLDSILRDDTTDYRFVSVLCQFLLKIFKNKK